MAPRNPPTGQASGGTSNRPSDSTPPQFTYLVDQRVQVLLETNMWVHGTVTAVSNNPHPITGATPTYTVTYNVAGSQATTSFDGAHIRPLSLK